MFFSPISGMITDRFNAKNKHLGIDLVAREKTRISSVLGGTIVISQWTSETGYVIGVQHKNDYLSLYKHNSVLLKTVGDFVNAGDPISIIGNSGELSSGPHLHFELWHQGIPVNPEDYILF
jgi:murein DD-endopeptidase MepM/ murein hydrolase activator NlpD